MGGYLWFLPSVGVRMSSVEAKHTECKFKHDEKIDANQNHKTFPQPTADLQMATIQVTVEIQRLDVKKEQW